MFKNCFGDYFFNVLGCFKLWLCGFDFVENINKYL